MDTLIAPELPDEALATFLRQASTFTPEWGQKYILPAFGGCPTAASYLCWSLPDHRRAEMAGMMYAARVSPDAFRNMLTGALDQTHYYKSVLKTAGGRRGLNQWLRYAAYTLPEDLGDKVTIYRGTYNCEIEHARKGLSWSLSFGAAAWFACRCGATGQPLVLEALVCRSDLLFYSNDRQEQEVIPTRSPKFDDCELWDNDDLLMREGEQWKQKADAACETALSAASSE